MIIESKKTKHQTVVTIEEWEALKANGYETHFRIISNAKELLKEEKTLPLQEVQEFKIIKDKQTKTKAK